jgi:hypothetical protein
MRDGFGYRRIIRQRAVRQGGSPCESWRRVLDLYCACADKQQLFGQGGAVFQYELARADCHMGMESNGLIATGQTPGKLNLDSISMWEVGVAERAGGVMS